MNRVTYANSWYMLSIHVVVKSQVRLIGHFVIDDMRFPFSALAFGRIGGHNIHLKLSKSTLESLRRKGYDPEWVQLEIQQKLIQGDIILPGESRFPGKDPL